MLDTNITPDSGKKSWLSIVMCCAVFLVSLLGSTLGTYSIARAGTTDNLTKTLCENGLVYSIYSRKCVCTSGKYRDMAISVGKNRIAGCEESVVGKEAIPEDTTCKATDPVLSFNFSESSPVYAIHPLKSGGFVAAGKINSNKSIELIHYSKTGEKVKAFLNYTPTTTGGKGLKNIHLTQLKDGSILLGWVDTGEDTSSTPTINYGFRTFDMAGTPISPEKRLFINGLSEASRISAALNALNDGGFAIVWSTLGSGTRSLNASYFDVNGSLLQLTVIASGLDYNPSAITILDVPSSPNRVISWTGAPDDTSSESKRFRYVVLDSNAVVIKTVSDSAGIASNGAGAMFLPNGHLAVTSADSTSGWISIKGMVLRDYKPDYSNNQSLNNIRYPASMSVGSNAYGLGMAPLPNGKGYILGFSYNGSNAGAAIGGHMYYGIYNNEHVLQEGKEFDFGNAIPEFGTTYANSKPNRLEYDNYMPRYRFITLADGTIIFFWKTQFKIFETLKTSCLKPMVIDTPKCFWMENSTIRWTWVSTLSSLGINFDKTNCFRMDSCDGGWGWSGGGCYKWSTSPGGDRIPW